MSDEQWYEVVHFSSVDINNVDVVRETEKTVFIRRKHPLSTKKEYFEERRNKVSELSSYIRGWKAAHALAVKKVSSRLSRAEDRMRSAKKNYDAIKNMTPPQPNGTVVKRGEE